MKMVSFPRNKNGDRSRLLSPKKSGFFRKQERSDTPEHKGLGSLFKKKKSSSYGTPPVTPDGKSPLNVTIVTNQKTPPNTPPDEGSVSDTISDLSASILPTLPMKSPMRTTARGTSNNDMSGTSSGTFSTHRGQSKENEGDSKVDKGAFDLMNMVDNACVLPTWANGSGNEEPPAAPAWGLAPSEDDDEDDEDEEGVERAYKEANSRDSNEGGDSSNVSPEQEGYELVLDASINQDAAPKHKNRVWNRKPKRESQDKEEQYRAVFGTDPEPEDLRNSSFLKRSLFSSPRKQQESSPPTPQMINVAEEILNPEDLVDEKEDLVGEQMVHDEEDVDESLAEILDQKTAASKSSKTVASKSMQEAPTLKATSPEKAPVEETLPQTPKTSKSMEEPARECGTPVAKETRSRSWGLAMSSLTKSISSGLKSPKKDNDADDDRMGARSPTMAFLNLMSGGSPEKKKREQPSPETPPKREKPLWKATVDPNTGMTYYYHRLTRVTTWTKPPDYQPRSSTKEGDREGSLSAENQKKADEGVEVPATNEVLSILRTNRSDHSMEQPLFTKKQQEIKHLLLAMAPPDPASVDKIIDEYRGREDELLEQLHEIVDSQPFDEPIKTSTDESPERKQKEEDDKAEEEEAKIGIATALHLLPARSLKSRVTTANSNLTGHSRKTQKTRNTKCRLADKQKSQDFNPLALGADSPIVEARAPSPPLDDPVPTSQPKPVEDKTSQVEEDKPVKSIKAPRNRELLVEEFNTTSRYGLKTEKYNGLATHRGARRNAQDHKTLYTGRPDSDDADNDGSEDESGGGESYESSVSGLSGSDADFAHHKNQFDAVARSALDEAIRNEDWDLAATVTEEMRGENYPPTRGRSYASREEWTQSSLDKFISDSDWDAVAKYIATMRDRNASAKRDPEVAHPPSNYSSLLGPRSEGPARKRFGARSQLQHSDLESSSSYDSGDSFGSDFYSTASSEPSHEHLPPRTGDDRKEFAC